MKFSLRNLSCALIGFESSKRGFAQSGTDGSGTSSARITVPSGIPGKLSSNAPPNKGCPLTRAWGKTPTRSVFFKRKKRGKRQCGKPSRFTHTARLQPARFSPLETPVPVRYIINRFLNSQAESGAALSSLRWHAAGFCGDEGGKGRCPLRANPRPLQENRR